ncbi:hypothetical protein H4R19_000482 [Coemansia spiralis]|nr:hypothetical protein H4R19_000482 [Coemansia spiralis]
MVVLALLHAGATIQKPAIVDDDTELLDVYAEALNRTLGFRHIYAIRDDNASDTGAAFSAVAEMLDIDVQYVLPAGRGEADGGGRQRGFLADLPRTAEIAAHAWIYADMVRRDIPTALILTTGADVGLDLKGRLAAALGGASPHLIDIIVVGRALSDPAEPDAGDFAALLRQTSGTGDPSAQMQRHWAKREFLRRPTALFPSSPPRGVHAYALNARMARRLHRQLGRPPPDHPLTLDSVLADATASGPCTMYSVSPPPLVLARDHQFLGQSARRAIGARDDDPAHYPPFVDWQELWT